MLNGVGARHSERYRVTSRQRAENSNQDLRSTLSVDRIDDQKVLQSHLESYTVSTWVSSACKNILKMPLREERVVLHINQVYSANKVWKDVRARVCGLKNIKNDSSNNVQGYRLCFILHWQR